MAQKPEDASNIAGSQDVFVRALTTQNGQNGAPAPSNNPVADARAKLQAQQTGQGGGLVRRLFGMAGGTKEVLPNNWGNADQRAFAEAGQNYDAGNYARAAGAALRGVVATPVAAVADVGSQVGNFVLPKIADFAGGLMGAPVAPVAAAAPAPAVPAPVAQPKPVASVAGQAVAPQPVMPNPQRVLSPATHSLQDFVKNTEGLTWRQAAQMMQWAPPDLRSPQMQAATTLNRLTNTAIGNSEAAYRAAAAAGENSKARAALDDAIARAQGAAGSGISSINPLLGAQMRRGMVAE